MAPVPRFWGPGDGSYSGSATTPQSIASALATAISNVPGSTVTAKSDGDVNILVSDSTGTATDYSVSASVTFDTTDFTAPSFAANAFAMSDGLTADASGGQIYAYYVPQGGYAANGNLQASSDSVMGDWVYGYDTLNRLTGAANALSTTASAQYANQNGCWAYDQFGNRTMEAVSTTPCANNPSPTSWAQYNGTVNGVNNNQMSATTLNPSQKTGYDAAGNVLNDGVNQYAFDGEGRLCAAQSNTTKAVTQYIYDAGGARVAKGTQTSPTTPPTCPAPSSSNFTLTNQYLNGQGQTELDGKGNWIHSNVGAGAYLATYNMVTVGTTQIPALHFHLSDPLGSRRVQTNISGVVEESYLSLPFGGGLTPVPNPNCLPANNCYSEDPTEHHLTGKERDAESGNDYFGARYFGSTMGRFMSPDWSAKEEPVPYAKLDDPQSLNLYAYVRNNPLSRVDLDGHFDCSGGNATGLGCMTQAAWKAMDNGTATSVGDYIGQYEARYAAQQQSGQQGQQSQWQTTVPDSGHYLTNANFPNAAGGAGHWGVGLDTPDKTEGFATNDGVPKFLRTILLAIGVPLPGAVHPDSMVNQSGVQRFYKPLTDAQFEAAQSAMNKRETHPGLYSLYVRNCALWDQSVDHAAGVSGVPHIVAFPMILRLWYPQ